MKKEIIEDDQLIFPRLSFSRTVKLSRKNPTLELPPLQQYDAKTLKRFINQNV